MYVCDVFYTINNFYLTNIYNFFFTSTNFIAFITNFNGNVCCYCVTKDSRFHNIYQKYVNPNLTVTYEDVPANW